MLPTCSPSRRGSLARLLDEIERQSRRSVPIAEMNRCVGRAAAEMGLYRPSYEQVQGPRPHGSAPSPHAAAHRSRPSHCRWPFGSSRRRRSCSASSSRRRRASGTAHRPSNTLLQGKTCPARARCEASRRPAARTRASAPAGAASWTDAGRPSSAGPHGSASAGQPSELNGYVSEVPPARISSSSTSAGGATKRDGRRHEQVEPADRLREALAVLGALALGRGRLRVAHPQAALDLAADVLAVQLLVAREERAVDVGHLAHEVGAVGRRERQLDLAPAREERRGLRHALAHERLGLVEPRDPDLELLERLELDRLEARRERRAAAARSPPTDDAIGPTTS